MPNNIDPQHSVNGVDVNRFSEYLSFDLNENNCDVDKSLYLPEELNDSMKQLNLNGNDVNKLFSCVHMNCRSIGKNIDSINSLLDVLNVKFSAIGVTETWLRPNDSLCNIDGYNFKGNCREGKRGGGVGIFIRNDFDFVHRVDLDVNNDFIERNFCRN